MTDAISRSAAIEEMSQITFETSYDWERAVNALKDLPALDVAPVVRCKDCANSFRQERGYLRCRKFQRLVGDNGYCSCGWKEEEGQND